LEISAGTGRNLDYFSSKKCEHVTLSDSSSKMLSVLKHKVEAKHCPFHSQISVQNEDATQLSFGDNQFDCVVDTFGLCSHSDPKKALDEMARVCKKDGGTVLMLEHGRTDGGWPWQRWLNRVLDEQSTQHAEKWGCWWNRDIEATLRESGLEIITLKRFHFGTTYYIVAKPKNPTEALQDNKKSSKVSFANEAE
jgi:methyltransferase OMS1